jgi:hypothetical protein
VAHDAHSNPSQRSLSDLDSCPAFHRWQLLRKSKITVDFHRIARSDSGLPRLQSFVWDVVELEESAIIGRSNRIYRRRTDGAPVVEEIRFSLGVD